MGWDEVLAWATLALVLATLLAAIFAGFQLKRAQAVAHGDFLLRLDDAFQRHNRVHRYLRPRGEWGVDRGGGDGTVGPQTDEDWADVESYMGQFERVQILRDRGLLELDVIDKLFGYRLRNLTSNKTIREVKLIKNCGRLARLHSPLAPVGRIPRRKGSQTL